MNRLQLYWRMGGCSNTELFRELFSIHTDAVFTNPPMHAEDTERKLIHTYTQI